MDSQFFQKTLFQKTNPLPGNELAAVYYKLNVKKQYDGLLILDFLNQAIPSVPQEKWISKIKTHNLKVNGQPIDEHFIVKASWLVEHYSEPRIEPFVSNLIQHIYEDEHVLVLNKPAPLPMHASGRFVKNTLDNFLKITFPLQKYKLIHRLDANTTGIVVFGKNELATAHLQRQFQEKIIVKEYLALVEGCVSEKIFSSSQTIGKIKTISGGRSIATIGTEAYTSFEVLERYSNSTLLKVIPKTGKTNQIRLHLANLGHPIIGDYGYKNSEYFENNPLTYPEDCLYLHAWKLNFKHPSTNAWVSFEAEKPEKFLLIKD